MTMAITLATVASARSQWRVGLSVLQTSPSHGQITRLGSVIRANDVLRRRRQTALVILGRVECGTSGSRPAKFGGNTTCRVSRSSSPAPSTLRSTQREPALASKSERRQYLTERVVHRARGEGVLLAGTRVGIYVEQRARLGIL